MKPCETANFFPSIEGLPVLSYQGFILPEVAGQALASDYQRRIGFYVADKAKRLLAAFGHLQAVMAADFEELI